jgi:hypothetical protein
LHGDQEERRDEFDFVHAQDGQNERAPQVYRLRRSARDERERHRAPEIAEGQP